MPGWCMELMVRARFKNNLMTNCRHNSCINQLEILLRFVLRRFQECKGAYILIDNNKKYENKSLDFCYIGSDKEWRSLSLNLF